MSSARERARRQVGRRWIRSAVLSAALLGGIAAHGVALAQPAPASADAEATFKRGLDAFDARDYLGAAAIWEPLTTPAGGARWKVLYNLGLAYQSAGDAARAIDRFEAFAASAEREASRPPELEERRLDALERARTLRAGMSSAPPIAAPPPSSALPPGPAAPAPATPVVAAAPVTTSPPPSSTPDSAPLPRRSFPTAWVLVGAGLTAASVALPLVLRSEAEDARADAEDLGAGHTGYAAARDDYESARSTYQAAWALPAALGAITAGIAVYGMVHVSGDPRSAAARPGWQVGVHASPAGGAVRASGRF
ncbi:MAG: hypothetical protein WKG00_24005 [Polyangiaceae bacterium]